MNKTKIAILGIVALFAVLTVSTASAYVGDVTLYFNPQNSNVSGYGETVEVEVRANAPDGINNGQICVSYDTSCAKIVDVEFNPVWWMTNWNISTSECWGPGNDWIKYWKNPDEGPGDVWLFTITIKGNSTEYCETNLHFSDGVGGDCGLYIGNHSGELEVSFDNGTFACGTPPDTYTINGSIPAAVDKVTIENLDNDKKWDAAVGSSSYELELTPGVEVNATETLRIISCDVPDNYTTNCNRTDHVVENCPGVDTVNIDALDDYCQNYYPTFPYCTWDDPNWSGPAAMQMLVTHYRQDAQPGEPTQAYLNATGIAHNQQPCNADLQYVDPAGMKWTLNDILHNTSSYGGGNRANYGIGNHSTIEDVLHYICKYQYLGPGAAPAYGDYANWMVVRGIHTNKTPSYTQGSYDIYGFWINDPKDPGGIGENTYKSVDQWTSTYHLNLTDVETCDKYYNRYVAVCEPPEDDDVAVTLARPKPRLAEAITPVLAEKPLMVYGIEQLAIEKVVKDDEMLKIVAAAIDGVNEELVPYDAEFTEVFAKTVPGSPMLVSSDNDDYYVVPFNVPVEVKPIKKMPVAIEKVKMSGLKKLERVKRVDERIIIKPIAIEPAKIERTLVVVVVDADDGSFKEASWVADPVKYLPVSKVEALELALGEIAITDSNELRALGSKPTIELVYRDASPYYPDWKITVNGDVFYVSQDGTVSS